MSKRLAHLMFTIFILLFFVYTATAALSFKKQASYFPLYISMLGILAMVIELVRQFIAWRKNSDKELFHNNFMAVIKFSLVIILYAGIVYVIGLIPATILYLFLFLFFISRMRWWTALLSVAILVVLIITFADVMNLYWHKSLIHIF